MEENVTSVLHMYKVTVDFEARGWRIRHAVTDLPCLTVYPTAAETLSVNKLTNVVHVNDGCLIKSLMGCTWCPKKIHKCKVDNMFLTFGPLNAY